MYDPLFMQISIALIVLSLVSCILLTIYIMKGLPHAENSRDNMPVRTGTDEPGADNIQPDVHPSMQYLSGRDNI